MPAFGLPVLVTAGATVDATVLPRVPLSSPGTSAFDEGWLQRTLFRNPQCLPMSELEPGTAALIPICMELSTPAGPADILYLTPTGRIVLVETKLFRNPEARREVIAQIIDYAKELTAWTYEDLARQVAVATGQPAGKLLELVRNAIPNLDEARFIDGVTQSLHSADMTLLIVGDGIRSSLEALVGFLDRYSMLRYSLALVEVGVFRLAEDQLLVQPRILAKTKVIERHVVRLTGSGDISPAEVAEDAAPTQEKHARVAWWFNSFWKEFAARLKLDDGTQPLPKISRTTNVYFPMPPSASEAWVAAYLAKAAGHAGVYLGFGNRFEGATDAYERLLVQRAEIEQVLGEAVIWSDPAEGFPVHFKMKIGDLDQPAERARVQEVLARVSNRFVNAFRSRLTAIVAEE